MSQSIEFYFDPISPFAWLASTQLERIESETGAIVIPKPILFAGLLKAHGHKGPAEIPAKREYTFRDVLRRAARYGVSVEGPPTHPFNPLLALRVCTAIDDPLQKLRFAKSVMHAAWVEGKDITDKEVIGDVARDCGVEPVWALDAAADSAVKQQLIDATQHAVDRGVFGVPCFVYNDQLFWGDDRIDDLLLSVGGLSIDERQLEKILHRPESVRRH